MCVGDLVLFDLPNRRKCHQLPGSWSCSWSVLLLQKGQGWLGAVEGCGTSSGVMWVQLRASWPPLPLNPLSSFLAKEPEWLHQNSEYRLQSLLCYAGDRCKPFDITFRRTNMDLRAIMNSATCFFSQVSLLFATPSLLSHPALTLCGLLENCLYAETGFSQRSTTQMLEHSLINRKKFGSWVELVVLTQILC